MHRLRPYGRIPDFGEGAVGLWGLDVGFGNGLNASSRESLSHRGPLGGAKAGTSGAEQVERIAASHCRGAVIRTACGMEKRKGGVETGDSRSAPGRFGIQRLACKRRELGAMDNILAGWMRLNKWQYQTTTLEL